MAAPQLNDGFTNMRLRRMRWWSNKKRSRYSSILESASAVMVGALVQGLTLVHFSAQRKHNLWDTSGA
jgi:hypothetical protein